MQLQLTKWFLPPAARLMAENAAALVIPPDVVNIAPPATAVVSAETVD